ncbi:hypothetical protein LFYK43_04950 [Ligilactobacillus salitolerans]|uniref:ADP-ribosylglycohydrolase n=1 Tax=Ligilactobacillus salitolerans TaxID=1808352 RepID=A0A401IR83_9LACO|nr:ADP-ribosylglycohydrolase family protein [Ligilactobacillus salitolerans]GBG94036.1 hypothetical protein LFYK43_04950 [Ligilactobacillus salitolerans]
MKKLSTPFGNFWLELDGTTIDFSPIDVTADFNRNSKDGESVSAGMIIIPHLPYFSRSGDLTVQTDADFTIDYYRINHSQEWAWCVGMGLDVEDTEDAEIKTSQNLLGFKIEFIQGSGIVFSLSYKKLEESPRVDQSLQHSTREIARVDYIEWPTNNCLLGGALGDALGYPVEFSSLEEIQKKYGDSGISFANFQGVPLISDDTQLTLFTANGLLLSSKGNDKVWACYQDWLDTQFKADKAEMSHEPVSWLVDFPEMFASREPGRTCLMTIMRDQPGKLDQPINQSKGCGALMRIAPIGLMSGQQDLHQVALAAAQNSALTHGHEMSTLASATLAVLLKLELDLHIEERPQLSKCLQEALQVVQEQFADYASLADFVALIKRAVSLAQNSESDQKNIESLGQGWVAEETLAIAIYCTARYLNQPIKAIEAAVNHDGDSDSTGAVAGQIVGICQPENYWWPQEFVEQLAERDVIAKMACKMVVNEVNQQYLSWVLG